jgi:hypothetical protein
VERAGQGQRGDAVREGLRAARGDAIAVLAEQGPDEGDVAGAGATRASRTPRRPRTWRWASERRWAGR